ncbi:hypothetical protein NXH40_30405, partial [Klebsiella pneumoniae]|nr:hypothetical protein [Klebsiella pneumoniae]MDS7188649.1 hypothetical protein [Klebsiella pneumoniae]MDS7621290.1 hypothetical protein [Klebsiella pneumoniae]MDS7632428.1 hypothetical protein [Klebsiella pneumoniae]MDS7745596.1 hypothetical protein [Klebsiella pneumoniae]
SAQIREILISESAWEEMTCLFAPSLEAAVNANWDANAECLKNEYGMSNEKIEEIRAKLHKLNRNVGLY